MADPSCEWLDHCLTHLVEVKLQAFIAQRVVQKESQERLPCCGAQRRAMARDRQLGQLGHQVVHLWR